MQGIVKITARDCPKLHLWARGLSGPPLFHQSFVFSWGWKPLVKNPSGFCPAALCSSSFSSVSPPFNKVFTLRLGFKHESGSLLWFLAFLLLAGSVLENALVFKSLKVTIGRDLLGWELCLCVFWKLRYMTHRLTRLIEFCVPCGTCICFICSVLNML